MPAKVFGCEAGSAAGPTAPTRGERLLMSAIRVWASRRAVGDRPHLRVGGALAGQISDRVGALFVAWIQAVEAASRRPIQIQCTSCGGVSADEQRLIVACGLASMAFEAGERLLEPLLLETRAVMVLARALNAAMAAEGLHLPARLLQTPVRHPDVAPTLH